MGEFGWAYVKGALTSSGPTGSLQFRDDADSAGDAGLTGSAALVFLTGSAIDDPDGPYELRLKGTLNVVGETWLSGNLHVLGTTTTLSASNLIISDPVIGLGFGTGSAHTGAAGDRGFIFGIKDDNNQAMFWDQSSASFVIGKVGEQAPSEDPAQGAGADYDVPGGDFSVFKVGGLIASGTVGNRNSGFIFAQGGITSSANIVATGSIKTATGDISGSRGIFTKDFQSYGDVKTSGSVAALGALSGGLGYFNKAVQMADTLRVSGTTIFGAGQGGALGPSHTTHHQLTGALYLTSSQASKISGSLSSSGELFGYSLRTSGELTVSGNVGIGTSSPDNKLTVAGGHISSEKGLKTGTAHFQWSGRTAIYTNSASDMVSYLNFGNHSAWGWIEVTITDGYSSARTSGKLTKRFQIGRNASTGINHQLAEVPAALGAIADEFKIGAFEILDPSGVNELRIPLYHLTSTGNYLTVFVEGELVLASDNIDGILGDLALSSPAEVSNSETRDYYSIMATRVGIGTVTPTQTLDVDGTVAATTLSGSRGIFSLDFQSVGDVKTSGSVTALGALSGGLGYFNKQVNMANNLRVSGTAFLGHGQGGSLGPGHTVHHNVTGALYVTSSNTSKFSGSLSSSLEVFGYSLRTSGDLNATGSIKTDAGTISGSQGIFTKDVQMASALYVSGAAVFNDVGGDNDFRVESDGDTHALFVEGSSNNVGIGTSAPTYTLDVAGDIGLNSLLRHNDDSNTYLRFLDDVMDLLVGGVKPIAFSTTSTHINPQNADHNFLVDASGSAAPVGPADNAFFVEGSSGNVGIGTNSPAAQLEVEQASAGGQTAVLIDNDDVDQIALSIAAANTTANVIDASGLAVTTHAVAALSASALTIGQVIAIDHNDTATTSVGPTSILIDFDKTGVQGNSQNSAYRGLHIMQNDAATNHAGSMVTMKGIDIEQAFTNNQGITTNFGLSISGSGADSNVGINICVDDTVASPCILMSSSLNVNDKGSITVGGNGAMTIQTIDLSHALADLTLDIDGLISASAANGLNPVEIQASTVNIQQGGLGIHTGGGIVATASIAVNTFSDPTSLKVNTGGGEVVTFGIETSAMAPGAVVYLDHEGGWVHADADAVASAGGNLLGVCLGDNITDGVLLRGFYHFATASVHQEHVTGSVVYLSTEAADITFSPPAGGGDVVRVIGYATDQVNLIYFNPSGDWIEL